MSFNIWLMNHELGAKFNKDFLRLGAKTYSYLTDRWQ